MKKLLKTQTQKFFTLLLFFAVCLQNAVYAQSGKDIDDQNETVQIISFDEEGNKIRDDEYNAHKKTVPINSIANFIKEGKPVHFAKEQGGEKRTIRSEWILDAIRNDNNVDIAYAIIDEDLDLTNVKEPVNLESADLELDTKERLKRNRINQILVINSKIKIEDSIIKRDLNAYDSNAINTSLLFQSPISFRNTIFKSKANFQSAIFKKRADFNSAAFELEGNGNANFASATFKGKASFSAVITKWHANFAFVTFERDTSFASADFEWYANFESTTFKESVYFSSATFEWNTNFESATFEHDANFKSAAFKGKWGGYTNFESTTFGRDANFNNAIFNRDVVFSKSKFHKNADFEMATFGFAYFKNTMFNNANFMFTEFKENADFWNVIVTENATFSYAAFKKDGDFWNSRFQGKTDFEETQFLGDAYFSKVSFKYVKFINTSFMYSDFRKTEFTEKADFSNVFFGDDADFTKAIFNNKIDFNKAEFGKNGIFYDAKFANDSLDIGLTIYNKLFISWEQLNHKIYIKAAKDNFPLWEGTYFRLIKNFEDIGDSRSADNAYYYYRYKKPKIKKEVWLFEYIFFGLTCGYGIKPFRSLIVAGFLILLFTFIYFAKNGSIQYSQSKKDLESIKKGIKKDIINILARHIDNRKKTVIKDTNEKNVWENRYNWLCKCFYFSVITFSPVKDDNYIPSRSFKVVAMVEGIFGWVTISLFLITLGNSWLR